MEELKNCLICPRNCGVNRYERNGFCKSGSEVRIAKAYLHKWEEPCISGKNGSGTVFFTNCNLGCVFCQNYDISHNGFGEVVTIERLVEIFLELMGKGAHNINLVTPAHYIPQIRKALEISRGKGLKIPVIYNSNGYENVDAVRSLDGLIDIYLPDLKYFDDKYSIKYSKASHYFEAASKAILEMLRQTGTPEFDSDGIMVKGLMIRHLMLPGLLFDSKKIVDWVLENMPREIYFNIMCQYTPLGRAADYPEINKKINPRHYEALIDYAVSRGLENGYFQEYDSATDAYVPSFDLEGL